MRHLLRPAALVVVVLLCGGWGLVRIENAAAARASTAGAAKTMAGSPPSSSTFAASRRDSLGDGFPDAVRIVRPEDRAKFLHWLTFLAEEQYYFPSPRATAEIHDCAGLTRFALRNALMAHNAEWRQSVLARPATDPDFGDLGEFTYPRWALGADLFRTRSGPLVEGDFRDATFAQFADAATLLHYNTFFISRDVGAARPGDLLFYYQPGQNEPYHSMLFVGQSYFQQRGTNWVVYQTGDLNGRPGEIREVEVRLLMQHPDPRWRPLAANPRFLGVYRFELLRSTD